MNEINVPVVIVASLKVKVNTSSDTRVGSKI